jgi:heptosyltransferase III
MKRILLCRTDAVGDLILTLPVVRSLKLAYPELHTAVLVSRYTAPLLAGESYIDDIATIDGRSLGDLKAISGLSRDLKRMNFETSVLFYPRLSLALALYLAKIPNRIGTGRRAYSFLFNRRVQLHRRDSGKHELDLNYDLVEAPYPNLQRFEPSLTVTVAESQRAADFLASKELGPVEKYILVHPLSHGSAANWRLERYVELIYRLAGKGIRILVTGSQLEAGDISAALRKSDKSVINIAGQTDLPLLKALIQRAKIIVSGSTGPIHMAGALGTFAVGIYPPESALSPVRWGPRGSANKLFLPTVNEYKGNSVDLMDTIPVESVYNFIIEHLESGVRARNSGE